MSTKTLSGMLLAALALTVAASFLDSARDTRAAWAKADELLFPGLADRASDTARLRIRSASGETTVELDDGRWTVMERGGYEGRADEVARLVSSLAHARRLEPKTRMPARYGRLGLGGMEDPDSPTVRLTLEDQGGATLADLFVGDRVSSAGAESWYVREPEAEETWSVEAKLRTPPRASEWLVTDLVDVARERISAVEIIPPSGISVSLERDDPEAGAFEISNLPEGRTPKSDRTGAAFLGSLAALKLADARPEADGGFPTDGTTRTTWRTYDGLVVTAELAEAEAEGEPELLARFSVELDPDRLPAEPMGPELPEPDGSDPLVPSAGEPQSRQEVESEHASLASRFEGWVFVLPSWKKTSLKAEMEELLEPLPELEPESPAPSDPPAPAVPVETEEEPTPQAIEPPDAEVSDQELTDPGAIEDEATEAPPAVEEEAMEDGEDAVEPPPGGAGGVEDAAEGEAGEDGRV